MHVYAPGANTDYRVVTVKIADRSLPFECWRRVSGSEIYHFKPLNERVPVYQKPFTLAQEVVLEGDRQCAGDMPRKERA